MSGQPRLLKESGGRVWHVTIGGDRSLLFNCVRAVCGTLLQGTDQCGEMPDDGKLCKGCERKLLALIALAERAGVIASAEGGSP